MTDIKLKVERCDECVFSAIHGPSMARRCHYGEDHCEDGMLVDDGPAPTDCPIRGKVVTIEGPGETDEQLKARVAEKLSAKVESCNLDQAHGLTREPTDHDCHACGGHGFAVVGDGDVLTCRTCGGTGALS